MYYGPLFVSQVFGSLSCQTIHDEPLSQLYNVTYPSSEDNQLFIRPCLDNVVVEAKGKDGPDC